MWKIIVSLLSGGLASILTPIFGYLNKVADTKVEIRKSDNAAVVAGTGAVVTGIENADNLNTQVRLKEGKWSPWTVATILGFMTPFGWHSWQVVLDSSRWVPTWDTLWGFIPYPTVVEHAVGSWRVAALPGLFETTEHAVIQSLFVGAGVAVGAIATIKALKQ